MGDIKAAFSKKEFEMLIEHVFAGNWVLYSNGENPEAAQLYQKLLQTAKENNVYKNLDYNELFQECYLPLEVEDEILDKIDEYNEDMFVEELVDIFVERDIAAKFNPKMLANMTDEKYMQVCAEEEKKYIEELNENGFENLKLL